MKLKRDTALKLRAIAHKGGRCLRCGFTGHHAAFVFHHIGKKELTWNQMRNFGWGNVTKELENCELLCANCHNVIHAETA